MQSFPIRPLSLRPLSPLALLAAIALSACGGDASGPGGSLNATVTAGELRVDGIGQHGTRVVLDLRVKNTGAVPIVALSAEAGVVRNGVIVSRGIGSGPGLRPGQEALLPVEFFDLTDPAQIGCAQYQVWIVSETGKHRSIEGPRCE